MPVHCVCSSSRSWRYVRVRQRTCTWTNMTPKTFHLGLFAVTRDDSAPGNSLSWHFFPEFARRVPMWKACGECNDSVPPPHVIFSQITPPSKDWKGDSRLSTSVEPCDRVTSSANHECPFIVALQYELRDLWKSLLSYAAYSLLAVVLTKHDGGARNPTQHRCATPLFPRAVYHCVVGIGDHDEA